LHPLRERYYAPPWGRFISEDGLGVGGRSLNLYTYASTEPCDASDPYGTDAYGGGYTSPSSPSPVTGGRKTPGLPYVFDTLARLVAAETICDTLIEAALLVPNPPSIGIAVACTIAAYIDTEPLVQKAFGLRTCTA